MNIAFRTDATGQIGTGHFMRCLTLADTLQRSGAQIRFVSRNLPSHLSNMLAANGVELVTLESDISTTVVGGLAHADWLGVSQEQDAQSTIQALSDKTWDWLIVDHYALDARWESALRVTARQIMVIDDIADRHHDCDLLLDQNLYSDMQLRYTGKVPERCKLLLGPRFALLRNEFRTQRELCLPRTGQVKRILVFFGGVDADNYTGVAINAMVELALTEVQVDVVIGAQHPCRSEIEAACAAHGYVCHVQTARMAEFMANADFAIGAGGTATWERCCLGLPSFAISVADNQSRQILDAAAEGLLYAPMCSSDLVSMIKNHTKALFENAPLLKLISTAAMNAVDGKGVFRIASALGVNAILIKRVTENDSKMLYEWRNHPSIRAVSNNSAPILWENHNLWFLNVLADKSRELLLGSIDNIPVGVIRFDQEGDVAEVSIYLVPDAGNTGQGRNLLLSAEQWLKINRPEISYIRAIVLGSNQASKRLFDSSGYYPETMSFLKKLES